MIVPLLESLPNVSQVLRYADTSAPSYVSLSITISLILPNTVLSTLN